MGRTVAIRRPQALTTWRGVRVAVLTGGLLCAVASRGATQPPPDVPAPFPAIRLDAFPHASRSALSRALRVVEQHPVDAAAVGALGMLLQAWQQYDAASAVYAHAQALAPASPDWWYLGGLADTMRGRPDAAARQFARAAQLSPAETALITLRLADARLAAGLDGEASMLYKDLTSNPRVAASAWLGLGRVALRRQDAAAARAAAERAIENHPEFGAAHYVLAQAHRRTGDQEAAAVALVRQQRCPSCAPMLHDPWEARVAALRDDPFVRLTRGIAMAASSEGLPVAIELHESAVTDPDTRGQAHLNLIELYGRSRDRAKAEQHYLAALALEGFAAEASRRFATVLLGWQENEKALELFRRVTTWTPGDALAWQGLALALEKLDRPREAAEAYHAALGAAPQSLEPRFGLARLAMREGRIDEAIAHLEALTTSLHAESPRYLFALSTAYLRRGRHEDAVHAGTRAMTLARRLGDEQMARYIEAEMRKLRPTP